jgi:hypothetical protein
MNLRNAFAIVAVLWLSLTLAAGQQALTETSLRGAETAAAPPDLHILFTGYLLGYYRVPDVQPTDFLDKCTNPQQIPSPAADRLLKELASQKDDKPEILVGMGDNFAVELGSRTYGTYSQKPDPAAKLYAKQRNPGLTATGHPGDPWPPLQSADQIGDNVACFLYLAGYDAIVPGRLDFYFGPERLQRIAQRLAAVAPPAAQDSGSRAYHPVRMLAANLIVKTTYWDKPDSIPEFEHRSFTPGFPDKVESEEITDHGLVLPFLRVIHLKVQLKPTPDAPKKARAAAPTVSAWLCELPKGQNPDDVFGHCMKDPQFRLAVTPTRKKAEEKEEDAVTSSLHPELQLEIPVPDNKLEPDRSFGLCLQSTPAAAAPTKASAKAKSPESEKASCVCFTVARPFLQPLGCTSGNLPSTAGCAKSYELPYVFKPESHAVIFGVVDPALKGEVGRDNLSWMNTKHGYSTSVDFLDPAPALRQAMQSFLADAEAAHIDLTNVRKVLLAQMSRDKAEALAVRLGKDDDLHFDIVVAASADYAHSSPVGNLQVDPRKIKPGPDYPPVVVSPWGTYYNHPDPDRSLIVNPLRGVDMHDPDSEKKLPREFAFKGDYTAWDGDPIQDGYRERRTKALQDDFGLLGKKYLKNCSDPKAHSATPDTAKPDAAKPETAKLDTAKLDTAKPENLCDAPDPFTLAVLQIMRKSSGADIAMLQKRDIFWGPFRKSESSGEEIERLLWKGDVLRVLSVTGATLQKALKESDAFDQADVNGDATLSGLGLVYLGLEPTKDENYVIDGALLDKNRVYTVATSNYITAGDTGYPELANPDDPDLADKRLPVPPRKIPPTIRSQELPKKEVEGRRISELVCLQLPLPSSTSSDPLLTQDDPRCVGLDSQQPPATGNSLFAASYGQPTDDKPKPPKLAEVWLLHVFDTALFSDPVSAPEIAAQDQARWHLAVNQISFGYKLATNNLSEAERAQFFNGFTEAGVEGDNSHTWTNSTQIELVHRGRRLEQYLRSQSDYSSTVQEQPPPATIPSVSRDKNRYQFDAGLFYHPFTFCKYVLPFCRSARKQYPENGFVFEPFRFDSPIVKELVDIGANGLTPQPLTLDRTQRLLMRTGWRTETAKFHFETGYEGGWDRGALDQIVTSQGTCVPMPSEAIGECLANLATPVTSVDQVRSTRSLHGFYLDWQWSSPLPFLNGWQSKPWTNTLQAQGDWFPFTASDDNSSDTRYLYDMTEKFSIPLPSSLSFQPSLEYFRYRNKFGPEYLRRWSPQATISWSFDFYSGGKVGKSIKHKGGGGASGSSDSE